MLFFSLVLAAVGSLSHAYNQQAYDGHPVMVAMRSSHTTQYFDVASHPASLSPTNLCLTSKTAPVNMLFQTLPGPINVQNVYAHTPGSFRVSESVAEPHRFVHTVRRPVVQEIREIISPVRIIRQEVRPVEESIQTVVARSANGVSGVGSSVPSSVSGRALGLLDDDSGSVFSFFGARQANGRFGNGERERILSASPIVSSSSVASSSASSSSASSSLSSSSSSAAISSSSLSSPPSLSTPLTFAAIPDAPFRLALNAPRNCRGSSNSAGCKSASVAYY